MKTLGLLLGIAGLVAILLITNEVIRGTRCLNIAQHYYHIQGEAQAKMAEQMTAYGCWAKRK